MSIGIPVKVLHEAEGHIITIETIEGEIYRGKLHASEDNMNCMMQNVSMTGKDGRASTIQEVYIRGSKIRFFILPDMLKNAPMFKRVLQSKVVAKSGKAAVLRAQLSRGRTVAVPKASTTK